MSGDRNPEAVAVVKTLLVTAWKLVRPRIAIVLFDCFICPDVDTPGESTANLEFFMKTESAHVSHSASPRLNEAACHVRSTLKIIEWEEIPELIVYDFLPANGFNFEANLQIFEPHFAPSDWEGSSCNISNSVSRSVRYLKRLLSGHWFSGRICLPRLALDSMFVPVI